MIKKLIKNRQMHKERCVKKTMKRLTVRMPVLEIAVPPRHKIPADPVSGERVRNAS